MARSLNAMEFAGKDALLEALHADRAVFERLVGSQGAWDTQTPCDKWEVRDLVGHMIDNTESYLERFEGARNGKISLTPWDCLSWRNSRTGAPKAFVTSRATRR